MTRHSPFPRLPQDVLETGTTPDAASPVGRLDDLPAPTHTVVMYLRLWCDLGPAAVETALAGPLGPRHAAQAAAAFHDLCLLCIAGGHAPLMRHHATCPCLGADEARFARLISLAATAPREEALELAFGMVRADLAPRLVLLATQAGLAILRAILCDDRAKATLH